MGVRTKCPGASAPLVQLPGTEARLTPFHPVQVDCNWCFPKDLAPPEERPCDAVFSFVLNGEPSMVVGGVPCVALAHGIKEGAAAHPYFGSERVLEDIAKMPGFARGLVDLPSGCAVRDPATGLVCSLCLRRSEHGGS